MIAIYDLTQSELECAEFGQTHNELLDMLGISDDDPRRDIADELDGYKKVGNYWGKDLHKNL